jgi:predicted nucleic acid-binding protein
MILLDTNLLGRLTDNADPHYVPAHKAIRSLRNSGEQLAIVPQNLYEFWAVATRAKAHNGLNMTPENAAAWIGFFRRLCLFLPDRPELAATWLELVKTHAVKGFKAHDVRLIAAMTTYGMQKVLTFNAADFRSFDITVIDPAGF